ncbi:hypothetical protein Pla175_08610 [Pirellulimonas nuda]|uniref:Uncharacterized protein n=1 Tax=Pirellulimonas nuda TaxID=2528009 RepID=A0A518D7Q8_9BACT|nr:hypothetical protein [Pirellulimonas nuda]QDU87499.1 hypothetical protein Pla175_08610 [Pirellulimonas nuda]
MPRNRLPSAGPTGLLGVAFDAADGHKRLTRGENFLLAGGSHETHAVMQEAVIKTIEQLALRGKELRNASPEEVRDLLLRAHNQ